MGKPGKSRVKFKRVPGPPAGVNPRSSSSSSSASATAAVAAALREESRNGLPDPEEEQGPAVNFVPCAAWIPRGAAKPVPEKVRCFTLRGPWTMGTKKEKNSILDLRERSSYQLKDRDSFSLFEE
jgi:hypothetical protein